MHLERNLIPSSGPAADEYDPPALPLSPKAKALLRAAAHLCNAVSGALKAFARELEVIAA